MFNKQLMKQLREEKGLTQTELAEKVGTTKQNIYKYESGIIANIPLSRIEAIAKILGVSSEVLAGWGPDTEPSVPHTLSDDEKELLSYYNMLSPIEKGRLLGELSVKCKSTLRAEEV